MPEAAGTAVYKAASHLPATGAKPAQLLSWQHGTWLLQTNDNFDTHAKHNASP